ncbi:hypothetical protein [Roseomonas indoligenes]|uniref:Uncharacterized protein n=1 Tax=Roseomonas indoligenes TaxID=2820811 RepID=A0A940S5E5_9PROT|nr:hypothetical protein [Pararoseomonas indoligenes]MBP0492944.1 hypothetical protein [Pararoseomonas indoligenes]
MAEFISRLTPQHRRVLDWLPPRGEWRELWFSYRPGLGPVPDEPILAGLEAAIAAGWAEGGEVTFGFDDDILADGARTMRAYCTTPAGLRMKARMESEEEPI